MLQISVKAIFSPRRFLSGSIWSRRIVHPFVRGVTFDQVWKNRLSGTYGNEKVFYASLDDLITMKKAAGRPKDMEDLNALLRLKK